MASSSRRQLPVPLPPRLPPTVRHRQVITMDATAMRLDSLTIWEVAAVAATPRIQMAVVTLAPI